MSNDDTTKLSKLSADRLAHTIIKEVVEGSDYTKARQIAAQSGLSEEKIVRFLKHRAQMKAYRLKQYNEMKAIRKVVREFER